jgi:hypothetical protein
MLLKLMTPPKLQISKKKHKNEDDSSTSQADTQAQAPQIETQSTNALSRTINSSVNRSSSTSIHCTSYYYHTTNPS